MELARKYGPVIQLQVGELPFLVISSPRGAKMMKPLDLHFAQRRVSFAFELPSHGNSRNSFTLHVDQWRQRRKICVLELLSTKHVHACRSIRGKEAWNMTESKSVSLGLPIDLGEKRLTYTNDVISSAASGNKCRLQEEFISLLDEIRKLTGGFKVVDVFPLFQFLSSYVTGMIPALTKSNNKIDKMLDIIIIQHNVKRGNLPIAGDDDPGEEDVIDVLQKLQESGLQELNMTIKALKAVCVGKCWLLLQLNGKSALVYSKKYGKCTENRGGSRVCS